jgi:hypothetical protein
MRVCGVEEAEGVLQFTELVLKVQKEAVVEGGKLPVDGLYEWSIGF